MLDTTAYLPILSEFEGSIPYMYLDTAGNVTVGVGNLLADAAAAQTLPFVVRPGPDADPSAPPVSATPDQIAADFAGVTQQPKALAASHYKQFTTLELPSDAILALLASRVQDFTTQLIAKFPDFNTYPAEACAAIFDMSFNLGLDGVLHGFPTFSQAVRTADWTTAAAQCHRKPPISNDRNNWTQSQFLQAANGTPVEPQS
jgi:GH24 family phage-related lysozyme (muramidase)